MTSSEDDIIEDEKEIEEAIEKNKEVKTKEKSNETKKERFQRLSSKRLDNTLDKIRILGNCSNKILYKYDFNDIDKIVKTLNTALLKLEVRFHFPIQTLEEGNTVLVADSNELLIFCPKHKEYYEVKQIETHNFLLECDCHILITKIDKYNGKYLRVGEKQ